MNLRKAVLLAACISLLGGSAGLVAAQQQTSDQSSNAQSLGDVARQVRKESKNEPKSAKTFTNDDVEAIKAGGISTVGAKPSAPPAQNAATAAAKPSTPAEPAKGEEYWKKRFSEARQKLALAEKELDIMQRELNLNQMQYYSDPNKSLQQQNNREEINEKTKKIDDKKAEVAQLKQALVDLTDELRQAGGQPGWAN
jgi:chromosome segregation ATPase